MTKYVVLGVLLALVLVYFEGHRRGAASVTLANATAIADANTKAVEAWQKAASEQLEKDAVQRAEDRAFDVATTTYLEKLSASYGALSRRKPPPEQPCVFTLDWVSAYNEVR